MKPKFRSLIAAFAPLSRTSLIVCVSLCASNVNAADQIWNGSISTDWNTVANWTSAVPATGDVAIFDATSTLNLATAISANASVAGVSVTSPTAAVSVASTASTLLSASTAVTADNATDVFTYTVAPIAPLANGDRVVITGTLGAGMTANTTYYVVGATPTTFQISTASGGAAVNFTANGTGLFVNGITFLDNTTDFFTYASAFGTAVPLANGDLVSFAAQTSPTGLVQGPSYFVVGATATSFQISLTSGGAPMDFTDNGANLRAFGNNSKQFTLGGSGLNLSAATQALTVTAPIVTSSAQTWPVATGQTLSVNGVFNNTNSLAKTGDGTLVLAGANTISGTSGVTLSGGKLTTRNGLALGSGTALTMANGTTYNYESFSPTVSTFQSNPINVSTSSSVTITTNSAGNGYSGIITGDSNSTVNIGATGALIQCSFSLGANTQQFGPFFGRVEIADGASIRFSSTSQVNNGGSAAIWDTNATGVITTRNTATLNLGSLVGSGSLSGSSGANGTGTFVIGGRGEDCTFDGNIVDATAGSRIAALTKVGSGVLTLTNATGLTFGGATNVNEGTLKINGVKSGAGTTTVKLEAILAGTGSVAGTTTVQSGGIINPGDGGVGNLTLSNLALSTGGILDLDFGAGNDTVTIASGGTLTIASGVKVDVGGFNTPGTYPIINYTGAITPAGLSAINGDSGLIYSFSSNGTVINMVISALDPNNSWAFDGDGSWGDSTKWSKGTVPSAPSAVASFGPFVGGIPGNFFGNSPIVTLDSARTVGDLTFNDNLSGITFTLTPGTGGSLAMDKGAVSATISSVTGLNVISAPIAVDAEGLIIDVADADAGNHAFTISGDISGSSVSKSGAGEVRLFGNNTYVGGTTLTAGTLKIDDTSSLGTGAATFAGGTLAVANDIAADARSYTLTGANNAIFNTNGFSYEVTTGIAPLLGATGGLTKTGLGMLTLTNANTYTGGTTVTGGTLAVATGGSLGSSTVAIGISEGATFSVSGGTVAASAVNAGGHNISGNLSVSGGSLTVAGNITSSDNDSTSIKLLGGTVSAAGLSLPRTSQGPVTSNTTGLPAAAVSAAIQVDGGTVSLGFITIGSSNSSSSVRVDSGSLTASGVVAIGANTASSRWNYLNVNGGTFTSTDAVTGIQIGRNNGTNGNLASLYLTGGVTTAEIITFGAAADTVANQSYLTLNGGTLYVGSGGLVRPTAVSGSNIFLVTGTLAAKADWTSNLDANLTGSVTIKAADAANASQNIGLSGVISGVGSLTKTGAGTLTLSAANTYTGDTVVNEGNLAVDGDSIADTNKLVIDGGKVAVTGTEVVASLFFGAVEQATGTWGATGSGATHIDDVHFTGTGKVSVGASGYSTWASANAGGQEPSFDSDFDGVTNGIEYFMNSAAGFTANPGLDSNKKVTWINGGNIPFGDYGTQFVVQTSDNLAVWTDVPATGDANLENIAGSVSYTLTGAGKRFVRLLVTPN